MRLRFHLTLTLSFLKGNPRGTGTQVNRERVCKAEVPPALLIPVRIVEENTVEVLQQKVKRTFCHPLLQRSLL